MKTENKKPTLGNKFVKTNQKIFFMCLLVFVFGLGVGAKASAARRISLVLIFCAGFFFFGSVSHANAANYCVKQDGSATFANAVCGGSCATQATCTAATDAQSMSLATLNSSGASITPSDTIWFSGRNGANSIDAIYTDSLVIPKAGTAGNIVTYQGIKDAQNGNAYPTITSNRSLDSSSYPIRNARSYVIIDGFKVIYTGTLSYVNGIANSGTISYVTNSNVTFDLGGYGYFVTFSGNSDHVTMSNISGINGGVVGQSIYVYGSTNSVFSLDHITVAGTNIGSFDLRNIVGLTMSDTSITGTQYNGYNFNNVSNATISYSYATNAGNRGFSILNGSHDIVFSHCTATSSVAAGFWVEGVSHHITFNDCIASGGNNDGFGTMGTDSTHRVHDVTFNRSRATGNGNKTTTFDGDGFTSHYDDYNINCNYCISDHNTVSGFAMVGSSSGTIYNSVAYANAGDWSVEGGGRVNQERGGIFINTNSNNSITGTSWSVKNSIGYGNYPREVWLNSTSKALTTMDYNVYLPTLLANFATLDGLGTASNITWENYHTTSGYEANSHDTDPLLVSSSDYHLLSASPAIDSGTSVGFTSDYASNPIYGTPDIGAYEYQPTHDMGAPTPDEPQIGETIRVYGDGKFRNTIDDSEDNATDTAELSIVPQASDTTKWLDLSIATWNTSGDRRKTWTENGDNLEEGDEIVNTLHTIGDLVSGQAYSVRIDDALAIGNITGANCISGVCTADENGEIAFTYTGGYSEHTFDIKDQTAPAVNIISPETGDTVSADDTIAFTDSETTSPQCSLNNTDWINCTNTVTNFSELTGWDDIEEKSTFTLYLKDTDAANNTGTDQVDNLTKADTQAPIRSNGSPSGELAAGTTSVTLGLKTDENATCRYDTAPKDYDDMVNTFTTTGEKTHSQTITNLTPEISYSYYVRCQDTSEAQNTNDTDYLISFSVAQESSDNEEDDNNERDINVNKVKAVSTENSITITWKTDHNAKSTIRYGADRNLKLKKKDNQKEKNHKVILKNLLPDTQYYFRIKSEDGNDNTDSSKIHLIKTQPAKIQPVETQFIASKNNQDAINQEDAIKRVSTTDLNPNICSYTVQSGDMLWSIAKKVYGDTTAYPLIIDKNKDKYPDIESKLSIGQELTFCDNNQNSQTTGNNSNADNSGQQSQSQNQTQPQPEIKTFHWWNPFSWF